MFIQILYQLCINVYIFYQDSATKSEVKEEDKEDSAVKSGKDDNKEIENKDKEEVKTEDKDKGWTILLL